MHDNNHGFYIAHSESGAVCMTGKMINRHGLVAGFWKNREAIF